MKCYAQTQDMQASASTISRRVMMLVKSITESYYPRGAIVKCRSRLLIARSRAQDKLQLSSNK